VSGEISATDKEFYEGCTATPGHRDQSCRACDGGRPFLNSASEARWAAFAVTTAASNGISAESVGWGR